MLGSLFISSGPVISFFLSPWTIPKCGHILDLIIVRTAPLKRAPNVTSPSQSMTSFPFIFSTSSLMLGILFIPRAIKSQWPNTRGARFSFTHTRCGSAGPPSGIQAPFALWYCRLTQPMASRVTSVVGEWAGGDTVTFYCLALEEMHFISAQSLANWTYHLPPP